MLQTIFYLITGKWLVAIANDDSTSLNRQLIHDGFSALQEKDRG